MRIIKKFIHLRVHKYHSAETYEGVSMRCHDCGTQNLPNFTFCIFCNTELNGVQEENADYGYLVCSKCKGYYELQEGEDLEEFYECECGGKLEFYRFMKEFL